MKHNLILGCGAGRCGKGFLSYFMFLNPQIAVWDGPGMGEMDKHVSGKKNLPLTDFHKVWGDDYQEPTHGVRNNLGEWTGSRDFIGYHRKRVTERRKSNTFFINYTLGERWYLMYKDHFDCNIIVIYCARDMINQYRSFNTHYHVDGIEPDYFLNRIRESLACMEIILRDRVPVIPITIPDYSMKRLKTKMKSVMDTIGTPMSKEQSLFLRQRRKLGASKVVLDATDAELLAKLQQIKDFEQLKERYNALKSEIKRQ